MGGAFTARVEAWLRGEGPKTIGALGDVFGDKGFAVTIMLLMSLPALPLPTGGVTHVLELVALLGSLQMALGRKEVWLPERLRERELPALIVERAVPFIVKRVDWFERHSRPRMPRLFHNRWAVQAEGALLSILIVAAAIAPPFSGLDTLPSLGAVIVSLSIILEDAALLGMGAAVGAAGIALIVAIGTAAHHLIRHFL